MEDTLGSRVGLTIGAGFGDLVASRFDKWVYLSKFDVMNTECQL